MRKMLCTSNRSKFFLVILVCLVYLQAGVGSAAEAEDRPASVQPEPTGSQQSPAPDVRPVDTDVQDAIEAQIQEHVAQGKHFFSSGQFALSIREWRAAYTLSPKPTYLFNVAQSHRRGGHMKEALEAYRLFLTKEPEHPTPGLRLEATNYVMELQTLLRQQAELDREKKRPLWKKPWFWGVLASATVATGVALGTGLGLGLKDGRDMLTVTFNGNMMGSALLRAR